MTFSLKVSAHSETGLVRRNNQDSAYASPTLIVVADGMGGAAAGDLASSVAITRLAAADGHYEGEAMLQVLADAMDAANDELADLIAYNPEWDGMGTTVCGALFDGTQLGLVHIGDSRGYLLRGGELTQLTHDHSWVQSLIDEGQLTPQEAATHPKRSLLVKVLNGQPGMRADLATVDLELGDRIMFCSDGLCGLVGAEMLARLMGGGTVGDAVRKLAAAARRAGGFDNITLVLAQVCEQDEALDAKPSQTLGAVAQVRIPDIPSSGGTAALVRDADGEEPDDLRGHGRTGGMDDAGDEDAAEPDDRVGARPRASSGSGRPRWLMPVAWVIVAVLVIAAALAGTRTWLDRQYYLGANGGTVGIYQGVPDVVVGVPLGHLVATSATNLTDLPPYYADQVRTGAIRPTSLGAAQGVLSQLAGKAQVCIQQRMRQSAAPTPSGSVPTGVVSTASVSPTPTPSAIPTAPIASDPEACS
ncbi:MAG: protein phosphatase 2C domain-containing protein [Propionibacteriaceae bacterium]|nr:protein phosphatase 2C domain-containing protein [Propionibacteriaceae bacterium]